MNSFKMQCLNIKVFKTSYQQSKKYMTLMKSLNSEVALCEILKCWTRGPSRKWSNCSGIDSFSRNRRPSVSGCSSHCCHSNVQLELKTRTCEEKTGATEIHRNCFEFGSASDRLATWFGRGLEYNRKDSLDKKRCDSFCDTSGTYMYNRFSFEPLNSGNNISNSPHKDKITVKEMSERCKFQKEHSPHREHKRFFKLAKHRQKGMFHCFVNRAVRNQTSHGYRCFHTSWATSVELKGPDFQARTEPPWRVLFFGTDQISVETLKRLHENMNSSDKVVDKLEVVVNLEEREVKRYALEQGLKVYDWPVPPMPNKYDVGVLVSFGHLIPDDIIHMFPYGILNMHPSLLPRWRGASPIIHTVLNGDPETGISITEIRPKRFDIGPVLMQRRFPVPPRCTSLQLSHILAPIGADMVIETLADLRTLERFEEEQDPSGVRYAHMLVKKNANVDWSNQTCDEIDQQFRAISEVMPLRSLWRGHRVKLFDMVDPDLMKKLELHFVRGCKGDITHAVPGTPAYHRKLNCIVIKCKDGVVGFEKLSVKKPMTAKEFLGGYLSPPDGSVFESLENDLNKFVKAKRMKRKAKV